MKRFETSAGDLVASRRWDFAEMLFSSGASSSAAEVMRDALEIAPAWAMGWFRLGEFYEAAGDRDRAAEAWRTALRLDPEDHAGALLKLALHRFETADASPSAFLEALFDQYAARFDRELVDVLGYRVPDLLAASILAERRHFGLAVDLGCGTGLMGARIRDFCDRLEGVDISAEMTRRARARGVYDLVSKADLQSFSRAGPPADLVTAADVLIYFGKLDRIMATVAAMLAADGLFAFSVERLSDSGGFALQRSRRYAHSEAYVTATLHASGLSPRSLEAATIRQDRGMAVEGLVVVAGRA